MIHFTMLILDIIYFISLYYAVFWLLTYLEEVSYEERKKEFKEWPSVSIVIPMYNEENNIKDTLEAVARLDYPSDKLKIFVVDDGSRDNSYSIAQKTIKQIKREKPGLQITLLHQENKGKFAAINLALKRINTPFFATLDADSIPTKDALKNILKGFTHERVAAVSPVIKIKNPSNMLQKLQWFEYATTFFYRKVIALRNSIHVTPGPLSTYRTKIVKELGGFKEGHKTEDMELALRLQAAHYELKQSESAFVYTKAPYTLKALLKQRIRWNLGSLRNIFDYSKMLFNREYGDFGMFQLPMIPVGGLLSISLLAIMIYNAREPLKRYFLILKTYHLNIFEYIKDSWGHFNAQFWFLNLNLRAIVMMLIFLSMTLFILYKGLKAFKEKPDKSNLVLVVYLFLYYFFLATVWVLVFKDLLLKKSVKWK